MSYVASSTWPIEPSVASTENPLRSSISGTLISYVHMSICMRSRLLIPSRMSRRMPRHLLHTHGGCGEPWDMRPTNPVRGDAGHGRTVACADRVHSRPVSDEPSWGIWRTGMAAIELDRVSKVSPNGTNAVSSVSLEVNDG